MLGETGLIESSFFEVIAKLIVDLFFSITKTLIIFLSTLVRMEETVYGILEGVGRHSCLLVRVICLHLYFNINNKYALN